MRCVICTLQGKNAKKRWHGMNARLVTLPSVASSEQGQTDSGSAALDRPQMSQISSLKCCFE